MPSITALGVALIASLTTVSSSFTMRVAHQQRGILTLDFDPTKPANSSIQLLSTTDAGYQPGWLHARGDKLFSISRKHFPDNTSDSAGIYSFQKLPGGQLSLIDKESSHGNGGVYVDISPHGKTLSSANIDGSTVSVFPLSPDGSIGEATYVFKYNLTQPGPGTGDSQEIANPHEAVFNPHGDLLAVPDRGSDRVYLYQVYSTGQVELIRNMTLAPGTGPRHLLFSPLSRTKTLMYLVSEIDNTINVFSLDHPSLSCGSHEPDLNETLQITHLQIISTLNDRDQRTKPQNIDLASEIALSNDGRFLYVSNRNTESLDTIDTLAIYAVDTTKPQPLQFLGLNSTHGKIPRHFSLSSDPRNGFVAVANQVTNDLHIMKRDLETGFLGRIAGQLSFGDIDLTTELGPMAVIWD